MNPKLKSLLTLLKTFNHSAAISELSEKLNLSENVSKIRGVQVPDTQEQYNWVLANQNEIINNANQNSL